MRCACERCETICAKDEKESSLDMLSPITLQKIDSGRICASICDERRRSSSGKSCPIAGLGEGEERRGGWKRSGEASTWEEGSRHAKAGKHGPAEGQGRMHATGSRTQQRKSRTRAGESNARLETAPCKTDMCVRVCADAPARTGQPVGGFVAPFMITVYISHSPIPCSVPTIVPLY